MSAPDVLEVMVRAARSYWGEPSTCPTVRFVTVPTGPPVQPSAWAYVEPTDAASCTVSLVSGKGWDDTTLLDFGYPEYCRLITHEFAHLLGLWDVAQPDTILSFGVARTVPDPPCDSVLLVGTEWIFLWHGYTVDLLNARS